MTATPIDRALCCGQTCGRSRPDQGECVASTHGRRQLMALEAAGYRVVPSFAATDAIERAALVIAPYMACEDCGTGPGECPCRDAAREIFRTIAQPLQDPANV